jgi:hypothetical protein
LDGISFARLNLKIVYCPAGVSGVGLMGGFGGTWVAILLVILGAGLVAWIVQSQRKL